MIEDEIIRTNMDTDVVVSSIKSSVHVLKGNISRKKRRPKANRNEQKQFWTNGYKI